MQDIAWNITIWLVAILALAFLFVALESSQKAEASTFQGPAGKIRAVMFWGVLGAGVPIAMVTLADLPYAATTSGDAQVIKAVGSQWTWDLSSETVVAGQPVEFHVTALDATHNFAIYDSDMTLLKQTQAMPEYTNILKYTFDKPGTYKVLCLEYCGLGHHEMMTEITVVGR